MLLEEGRMVIGKTAMHKHSQLRNSFGTLRKRGLSEEEPKSRRTHQHGYPTLPLYAVVSQVGERTRQRFTSSSSMIEMFQKLIFFPSADSI
uniref:Uncharacterized protein n=1 Tax=Salix viminalis TaxID=40686 RepID=A0A6N2K330_SALVM